MNKNYEIVEDIISKTQPHGVVIDTNLLLLLIIGIVNKKLVTTNSRLSNYIQEDFELLEKFLKNYQMVLVTPTILAEVSNLANSLEGKYEKKFYSILQKFTDSGSKEVFKKITTYNSTKSFHNFGVTDSNIAEVAKSGALVLTDDLPLAQYLQSKSLSVLNFNNIRIYGWK
ncbi:MAG: hypothetical protein WEA58_12330 [Balneolaceae bacterium]